MLVNFLRRRISLSLDPNDKAAMVSIAAAIGIPMQEPAQGLLPAVIIAAVFVGVARFINA